MLLYQSEVNEYKTNNIYIQWIVTYRCNYKCDYCYLRENKLLGKDSDVVSSVFDLGLKKIANNLDISNCRFDIMGGEPTLHPNIEFLLNAACKTGFNEVNLNTNGSLLEKHIKTLASYPNAKIILSYHPYKCDYDFEKLVSYIVQANVPLEVNVMFPPNCQLSYNMYDYLTNNYYNNVKTTIGLIMPLMYKEDEYHKLNDLIKNNKHNNNRSFIFVYDDHIKRYTNEEIRLYGLNVFKGMRCFVKYFTIDPNGKIDVLCNTNVLNSSFVCFDSTMSHINEIIYNGIVCENDKCGCSIGYNFKKVKK
ncbi:MAG TPA: radical SAM protein [Bacilli bacterium]|nr:radical SAM protein [Bacilli bacterium]